MLLPAALEPPRPRQQQRTRRTTIALRFALQGAALPSPTETLRFADRFRAAALRRADRLPAEGVARLRGRDPQSGEILRGNRHAHYLPTDEDGDGRLVHLTVYCPDLLAPEEVDALAVSVLRSWAFDYPIGLVLLDELRAADLPGPGPLGSSSRWRSHAPFLPPRRPKRRGGRLIETYGEQVALELRRRGLHEPRVVRSLSPQRFHWGAYRRSRSRACPGGSPPAPLTLGLPRLQDHGRRARSGGPPRLL